MSNINNHQGNANQNCNEISPYALDLTPQNGYHQKEHTYTHTHTHTHTHTQMLLRMGRKGIFIHCNVN